MQSQISHTSCTDEICVLRQRRIVGLPNPKPPYRSRKVPKTWYDTRFSKGKDHYVSTTVILVRAGAVITQPIGNFVSGKQEVYATTRFLRKAYLLRR